MKRSFSPHDNAGDEQQPKSRKLSGFFSAIKSVFTKPSDRAQLGPQSIDKDMENINQEAFPASFVLNKRKSFAAAHAPQGRSSIPRSSISMPSSNGNPLYQARAAADSMRNANDSDLLSASVFESQLDKEVSPSVFIPKNQILPTNPEEMDLEDDGADDMQPIVIEHEFAGMYRDEKGDLVRPPFINLDPRERYHMLQLKKSVEASEFLQNRLKYMVDPDETTSVQRPGNKVDTSTQTHNTDYLEKSLHFTALRKKLALQNRKQRREKKKLGLFSGEFYYEPSSAPATKDSSKFSGYLGDVAKPEFSKSQKQESEPTLPDDDSRSSINRKPWTTKPGLDDKIRYEKNRDIVTPQKISDVIKLKPSQPTEAKKSSVGPSTAFNFEINKDKLTSIVSPEKTDKVSFTPKASESQPAKRGREESEEPVSKPAFSFGQSASASKPASDAKPAFSFGGSQPASKPLFSSEKQSSGGSSKEETLPKFSFGGEKKEAPAFSFGNKTETKEPPKFAFGTKNGAADSSSEKKDSVPDKSNGEKPSISFGEPKLSSPAFSFGTKPSESLPKSDSDKKDTPATPTFSFGKPASKDIPGDDATKSTEESKPAFSFGSTSEKPKPAFNFSANVTKSASPGLFGSDQSGKENSGSGPQPSTNTGSLFSTEKSGKRSAEDSAPETKKPAFNFGPTETPKFSFGTNPQAAPSKSASGLFGSTESTPVGTTDAEKKDKPTPAFSFGQKPSAPESTTPKPAFSFGQTDAAASSKESTPGTSLGAAKPAFSFGNSAANTNASAPFGAASATPQPAQPAAQSAAQPAFSFGQNATADPSAIFGGGSATPGVSTPAPSFSFSVGPLKKDATPTQPDTAPKSGGFSFSSRAISGIGGSRPTTPSGFSFGGGSNTQSAPATAPAPAFGGAMGSATAPSSVFGGDASRSVTPNFGFGQAPQLNTGGFGSQPNGGQAMQPSTSLPGAGFGAPANPPQQGGFSFGNNNMGSFNSAPGSFGQVSREQTPPAFGGPANGTPPAFGGNVNANTSFTPPIANVSGRRIAQMRQRKRF